MGSCCKTDRSVDRAVGKAISPGELDFGNAEEKENNAFSVGKSVEMQHGAVD